MCSYLPSKEGKPRKVISLWPYGENVPENLPAEPGNWFRLMWLSHRDLCQLFDRCLEATPATPFLIINGMSANTRLRWKLEHTPQTIGYEPQDDVTG